MIKFIEICEQKIQGEYNKVCRLTSVFDIMQFAATIKINFDEAQQLITKACESFGVVNSPIVKQAKGRQEYQIFGKIFLRQPTTVHATLHELAHYLTLGKNDQPKKVISKKLLRMYYDAESIDDLNEEDKKEALIYATKFRFEPHGSSFVAKLDELLKWWKEYECKYQLSEQKEIKLIFRSFSSYWIDPDGNRYNVTGEHDDWALRYLRAQKIKIDHLTYLSPVSTLLKMGWIREIDERFEVEGLTRNKKDIIFMIAKDRGYKKIWVDDRQIPIVADEPPEALYESINKPLRSQAICDNIHFAVITSSGGEYGYGVFSWHTDEFSAKYNAKVTGGYVVPVEQDERGWAKSPKIHTINALKKYLGDEYTGEPSKPKLRIVKEESLVEMVMPREIDKSKIYYHGTKDKDSALNIMKNGLLPPNIKFIEDKYKDYVGADAQYKPIAGHTYLTQDLETAIFYATDMHRCRIKSIDESYVVVINGVDLKNIEPDEDAIGSIAIQYANWKHRKFPLDDKYKKFSWLYELTKDIFGDYWKENYVGENNVEEPEIGKRILSLLSDEQKYKIIDAWEGSMAHVGSIQPDSLWEFSNRKFCERFDEFGMTKKGFIDEFVSNFFSKYARRIK